MSLAATQLRAFINSKPCLQKAQRATWGKLARKKRNQMYAAEVGVRAFRRVADTGAKSYVRELGVTEKWSAAFPAADRDQVARELERDFRARYATGQLDSLLPAKMRPRRKGVTGNPIRSGYDRATISDNIRTLRAEGKPPRQAIAIALESARDSFRAAHPGRPLPSLLRAAPAPKKKTKKKTKKRATKKRTTKKTKKKRAKKKTKKRTTKKRTTKKKTKKRATKKRAKKRTTKKRATKKKATKKKATKKKAKKRVTLRAKAVKRAAQLQAKIDRWRKDAAKKRKRKR